MLHKSALLLLVFFTNIALASATATPTPTDKPINVGEGMKFEILLSANATTGYSWYLKDCDNNLLMVTRHQYHAPAEGLPGEGGLDGWEFSRKGQTLHKPYVTTITFEYARPWDSTGAKEQSFTVYMN